MYRWKLRFFAEGAVEAAEELVEVVFEFIKRKVPSAGIIDLVATEGFFELSETIPRMGGIFGSGDTPEVKGVGAIVFGIENHLDEEGSTGAKLAVLVISGGVGVKTGAVVIVDEGGGDGDFLRGIFWGELGDVESGEAGFELIFEMTFVLGNEVVAVADGFKEVSQDGNVVGILRRAIGNTFFLVDAPVAILILLDGINEIVFGLGEIENPGMGRIEVVRLDEMKGLELVRRKGIGWFDADEEGGLGFGEIFKSVECVGKGGCWGGFIKRWPIGAIEIIAERSSVFDGEGGKIFAREGESLVVFEFVVGLPSF